MRVSNRRVSTVAGLIRGLLGSALFAGLGFVGTASAVAAPPDLKGVYINGPEQGDVGQSNVINLSIVPTVVSGVYDPNVNPFTADVRLRPLVPGPDIVVGNCDGTILGVQYVTCLIPDLPVGFYTWVVKITNVPGEVDTSNNEAIGQTMALLKTDLELDDDSPIVVGVDQNAVGLTTDIVGVQNIGTPDGILVFNITATPAVPWLDIDPISSFAAGGSQNNVTLTFDHTGLELGTYTTKVKFYNVVHSDDFKEVDVTLTVGKPRFWPGDRIRGQIDNAGENDEVIFDAVEGEKVGLRLMPTGGGNLDAMITILDEADSVVKVFHFSPVHKFQRKTLKLDRSGTFKLRVEGEGGTTGVYKIRTSRKYPKLARPRVLKLNSTSSPVDVNFLAVKTAELNFSVDPNADFAGPTTLGYTTATGGIFDLTDFSDPGLADEIVVSKVPISTSGEGVIHISGFGAVGNPGAKVHIWPVEPVPGKARIILH